MMAGAGNSGGGGGALRELLAKLGVQVDTKEVDKADEKLSQLSKKVLSFAAVWKVVDSAFSMVNEQIKRASEIKIIADQFGMTTDQVQKYQVAAEQVGLTTHQMVTAFKILENHVGASGTLTGMQHSIKMFGQYGVSTRDAQGKLKGLPAILGDVADKMSKMDSPAQKIRFANEMMGEMGFRMIPLLQNGRKGVEEFFGAFDRINLTMREGVVNNLFLAGQKVKILQQAFKTFQSELANGSLPILNRLVGKLTEISSWLTWLARKTTGPFSGWYALIVAVMWASSGLLAVLLGFAIPLAIIGLLYIIFDDFFALLTGKRSLIGEVLDEAMGAGTAAKFAKELKDAWEEVKKAVEDASPSMRDMGSVLLKGLILSLKVAAGLLKGFAGAVGWVNGKLQELFGFVDLQANADAIKERAMKNGMSESQADELRRRYIEKGQMDLERKAVRTGPDMTFRERPSVIDPRKASYGRGLNVYAPMEQQNQTTIHVYGNADQEVIDKMDRVNRVNAPDMYYGIEDAASQGALFGGQ